MRTIDEIYRFCDSKRTGDGLNDKVYRFVEKKIEEGASIYKIKDVLRNNLKVYHDPLRASEFIHDDKNDKLWDDCKIIWEFINETTVCG